MLSLRWAEDTAMTTEGWDTPTTPVRCPTATFLTLHFCWTSLHISCTTVIQINTTEQPIDYTRGYQRQNVSEQNSAVRQCLALGHTSSLASAMGP